MCELARFLAKEYPSSSEYAEYFTLAAEQGDHDAQFSAICQYFDGHYMVRKHLDYSLLKKWAAELRNDPETDLDWIYYLNEKKI